MTINARTTLRSAAAAIAVFGALTASSFAQAQQNAEQDYKASMDRMNAAMMKGMDPDPTKAWAKMMIAHHQGAIDMSQTVLKETKDPMIRKMAEKGIKEQKEEQKMLQKWVDKH